MKGVIEPDARTTLFGVEHAAPIGVAPLGMSGLIWPGATRRSPALPGRTVSRTS